MGQTAMPLSDYEKLRMDQNAQDVATALARVEQLEETLKTKVSQDAFLPVKMIAYSLMGTIGWAVLILVLKRSIGM